MYVAQFKIQPDPKRALDSVPSSSVASMNTHDAPPFAAFWNGLDIESRKDMGLISEEDARRQHRDHNKVTCSLVEYLKALGHLGDDASTQAVHAACIAYLADSPAELVLVNLEDLWQETEPQNVPGTGQELPNWPVLGDALLQPGASTNMALSVLFVELFPGWLAALLGIGILAAVMSTADGLVISSSQIIANDLYRCTIVPRFASHLPEHVVDRRVLIISRVATVGVMVVCTAMAWALVDRNVALIVWIGTGGMMAAFAGPLVIGAVWRGITKAGAFAGLIGGVTVFSITHGAFIDPNWFDPGRLQDIAVWLVREAPNPWSCAAMGEIVSVALTYAVSKLTQPLPDEHLTRMFGAVTGE